MTSCYELDVAKIAFDVLASEFVLYIIYVGVIFSIDGLMQLFVNKEQLY